MQVEVVELGRRPSVMTKARLYAPAGAAKFGSVLEPLEFADIALLALDWSNELATMPSDAVIPVLHIRVMKKLPEFESRNLLTVDARLDVEDIFGGDEITAEDILDIVHELEEKVNSQVALRRS